MHTNHDKHMLIMLTHMILFMLMYKLVHIVEVWATLQSFVMIEIHALNFASKHVCVRKGANSHRPKKVWVPKSIHFF